MGLIVIGAAIVLRWAVAPSYRPAILRLQLQGTLLSAASLYHLGFNFTSARIPVSFIRRAVASSHIPSRILDRIGVIENDIDVAARVAFYRTRNGKHLCAVSTHLPNLSFLCLGIFVGTTLTGGLALIKTTKDFKATSTTILSGALGGVVFIFLKWLDKENTYSETVYVYPIGLICPLMWYYLTIAIGYIFYQKDGSGGKTKWGLGLLGALHFLAVVLITALIAWKFVWPVIVDT